MTARNLPDPSQHMPAPHHRRLDADTERAAAALATPRAGSGRALALAAIAAAGPDGLTHAELAAATGVEHYSIAPRCTELVRLGWVCDSGARRPAPGKRVGAKVWVLTDDATAQLSATNA